MGSPHEGGPADAAAAPSAPAGEAAPAEGAVNIAEGVVEVAPEGGPAPAPAAAAEGGPALAPAAAAPAPEGGPAPAPEGGAVLASPEEATVEEQTAAATKLQALHRGNQDRKAVENLKGGQKQEGGGSDPAQIIPETENPDTILQKMPAAGGVSGAAPEPELSGDPTAGATGTEGEPARPVAGGAVAGAESEGALAPVVGGSGASDEQAAATRIQAIHRGNQDRKAVEDQKQKQQKDEEMGAAAIKIQAAHRGNEDRKAVENLKKQQEQEEMAAAATMIQAAHRGNQGRKSVADLKEMRMIEEERQEEAAVKLQAVARGNQDRKRVDELCCGPDEHVMGTELVVLDSVCRCLGRDHVNELWHGGTRAVNELWDGGRVRHSECRSHGRHSTAILITYELRGAGDDTQEKGGLDVLQTELIAGERDHAGATYHSGAEDHTEFFDNLMAPKKGRRASHSSRGSGSSHGRSASSKKFPGSSRRSSMGTSSQEIAEAADALLQRGVDRYF